MRILITGSSGFLGQYVVAELTNQHELFTPSHKELDILNHDSSSALGCYCTKNNIDAVIHLCQSACTSYGSSCRILLEVTSN